MLPDFSYDGQGQIIQTNAKNVSEVLINSLESINIPILGRPFFTSAYFIVDHDRQQFTLAKVNATNNHNPVTLGPPTCDRTNSTATPASGASGDGQASTAASSVSKSTSGMASTHQGLSKGAVAGAVVGSVAAVALCLGTLILLIHGRQHVRKQSQKTNVATQRESTSGNSQQEVGLNTPEMSASIEHQAPAELPLERHSPAPIELPLGPRSPSSLGHSR